MSGTLRGLVAIPARNEEKSIGGVLEGLGRELPGLDVLVVDDGSSDGTRQVAEGLGATVAHHPCNLGYGRAIQTAIKYARVEGYDHLVTVDADGQHPPEAARSLLERFLAEDLDLCIGSRFVAAGGYRDVELGRRAGMLVFSWLSGLVVGQRFYDTTSGLKVMRASVFEAFSHGHFVDFHVEAIVYLTQLGFRVGEHPVVMRERQHGRSMYSLLTGATYPMKTMLMVLVALLQAQLARRGRLV